MKKFYLCCCLLFLAFIGSSQCETGETEVYFNLYTDNWGYEAYWELLPFEGECGVDYIFQGGNLEEVSCIAPENPMANAGNGYPSNSVIEEGPFCLTNDEVYDIVYVDDYSDGGLIIEVIQDDIVTSYLQGEEAGNTWSFTAGDLTPAFSEGDRPCEALEIIENGNTLIIDNTDATASFNEVTPPGGFCGAYGQWCNSNGEASNTVWIKFTPETTGSYEVSTCNEGNEYDTALAVYSVEDCLDFDSYTLLTSNDDSYVGCNEGSTGFASICYVSCLNVGEEYYIQLDGWNGDSGITELSLTSYTEDLELNAIISDARCPNLKEENESALVAQVNGLGVDYDITWTGPFGFQSNNQALENVPVGEYTCIITNACGVELTNTFEIEEPEPITADLTLISAACDGVNDGGASVQISGGEAPYDYTWNGPNKFTSEEEEIADLESGNYTLIIEDDNDCMTSIPFEIENSSELSFSLGDDITICTNQTALLEGPVGFYLYEWQDGSAASNYEVNGNLGAGSYPILLTITDTQGCEFTDVANVTVDNCVGVVELTSSDVHVYPNPVEKTLNVSMASEILKNNHIIQLFDISGRMVSEIKSVSLLNQMNVNDMAPGAYTLQVKENGYSVFQTQFIKR